MHIYCFLKTLYYYYSSLAHMSRKPTSSRNSIYQERIKSCFSKKNSKAVDNTPYEQAHHKHSKPKIQPKKTSVFNKKQTKDKITLQTEERVKTIEEIQNKGLPSATQKNYISDCIKQVEVQVISTKQQKTSPDRKYQSKDELIKNCNLNPLKTLICEKLNDCDFFSGEENIKNSSKRLLFMQYKNEELYINTSKEKSRIKEKVIPKDIQHVFQNVKSPKNYFSINSRIPTEQTYDTSDPSNCSKMTPPNLTPRQNMHQISIPNRRSSFTFAPLNISEIEKQQMQHSFYPAHSYYYYGGFCVQQSMDFPDQAEGGKTQELQYKSFNINLQVDRRTTLMIKNIPNKYTREMLIELFDRNHKKHYDFLYLPIDPQNSCNIGYAFINFLSWEYIREFYWQFNGEKWEKFNSEKICRLSYARMQGTSSLVEHMQITTPKNRKIKNLQQINTGNLSSILQKQRQQKYE